jgi:ABC-type lipoprotein release transport system permease subunit
LYATNTHEVDVYVVVAVGLVAVGAVAAWLPGRRAAEADPMTVLRGE